MTVKTKQKFKIDYEFEIISVFNPADRLDELDEIPKLPNGLTDYWQASKLLCEKDGGRMPSVEELQIISAADRAGLINTGLDRNKWFWSSTENSDHPQYLARFVCFNDGDKGNGFKNDDFSYGAVLCLGK